MLFVKANMKENQDVDTVDTGFRPRKQMPEQRIEVLEREVEELKKNLGLNSMD